MSLPSTDDARTQVFALISSMSQAERLKALLPCLDGVCVCVCVCVCGCVCVWAALAGNSVSLTLLPAAVHQLESSGRSNVVQHLVDELTWSEVKTVVSRSVVRECTCNTFADTRVGPFSHFTVCCAAQQNAHGGGTTALLDIVQHCMRGYQVRETQVVAFSVACAIAST